MNSETRHQAQLETALQRLAQLNIPRGRDFTIEELKRLEGGYSRETWCFDLHWSGPKGAEVLPCVLQRSPVAGVLQTDRTLEFHLIAALAGKLPVPTPLWLDTDGSVLGRPGFVVRRLPGRSGGRFLGDPKNAKTRDALAPQFAELAARLHSIDWAPGTLPYTDIPSCESVASVQLDEWEATLRRQATGPEPLMEDALLWLRRHAPVANRISLLWGDIKFENILYEGESITAVLDWELAHLGDPMEDVAWAYRWFASTADVLPLATYLQFYEQSGGHIDRRNLDYYALFTCFKAAVISITGIRSFVDGATLSTPLPLGSGKNRLSQNLIHFQRLRSAYESKWQP